MITVLVFYISGEACLAYTYEIKLSLQLNGLHYVKWSSTHTFQGIIFNGGRTHEVTKILAGVVICVCYKIDVLDVLLDDKLMYLMTMPNASEMYWPQFCTATFGRDGRYSYEEKQIFKFSCHNSPSSCFL